MLSMHPFFFVSDRLVELFVLDVKVAAAFVAQTVALAGALQVAVVLWMMAGTVAVVGVATCDDGVDNFLVFV